MQIEAVIFDMDGVLVDSEPLHREIGHRMLGELGIAATREVFNRFTGITTRSMMRTLVGEYNLEHDPELLTRQYNSQFLEGIKTSHGLKLYNGVEAVLSELKREGLPVALASSSTRQCIEEILKRFGITNYFDVIVSGDDGSNSKPHPEIFLKAAKKLGVKPEACAVIEDSTNGVAAARRAGMYCIGFKPEGNKQDLREATTLIEAFNSPNFFATIHALS